MGASGVNTTSVAFTGSANYNPIMTTLAIAHEQIEQAIRSLPPPAQMELVHFIDYLHYKYSDTGSSILALEGLWADINLDVDEEDVRRLREDVSTRLIDRFSDHELPG